MPCSNCHCALFWVRLYEVVFSVPMFYPPLLSFHGVWLPASSQWKKCYVCGHVVLGLLVVYVRQVQVPTMSHASNLLWVSLSDHQTFEQTSLTMTTVYLLTGDIGGTNSRMRLYATGSHIALAETDYRNEEALMRETWSGVRRIHRSTLSSGMLENRQELEPDWASWYNCLFCLCRASQKQCGALE
jgi:hypothetical protein